MKDKIREYKIEGLIGRGGMGSVYLATHVHLQTKAALKILHEYLSDNVLIKGRFVNEARILHQLRHSNIVEQKEFFEENGQLILVMEYIEGKSLDEMIGQDFGPIPWEQALPLFLQILEGVGFAHSRGVIHRDVKPANILVSIEGKVKITDLGIAKITGQHSMTSTGAQLGTLHYESPEQIQGARNVDHRSDIYSLGMTLYEMLAGRLPFDLKEESSEFVVMQRIVTGNLPDPRKFYPHISDRIVQAVQKAIAPNPDDRFQSCREFSLFLIAIASNLGPEKEFWSKRATQIGTSTRSKYFDSSKFVSSNNLSSSPVQSKNSEKCRSCGKPITIEMEFCRECGADLSMKCPSCDKKIRAFGKFCPACGIDFLSAWQERDLRNAEKRMRIEEEDRAAGNLAQGLINSEENSRIQRLKVEAEREKFLLVKIEEKQIRTNQKKQWIKDNLWMYVVGMIVFIVLILNIAKNLHSF